MGGSILRGKQNMDKSSTKVNKYFISFIEEFVQDPLYQGYIGGRIEVYKRDEPYACNEIRFFTHKVRKFRAFRDRWDMKNITWQKMVYIEWKVKQDFYQFPKRKENP